MKYWSRETIEKIRMGFYSAAYFSRARDILLQEKNFTSVTMQIFQKHNNTILCGISMVKELLEQASGYYKNNLWVGKGNTLTIENLQDGDITNSWEAIIHITGPYAYFAHLESLYLGILARASNITTNTTKAVSAANNKPVLFFADRFDYFLNQKLDGYAAQVGGVSGVATEAQGHYIQKNAIGTLPHALIAVFGGNTIASAQAFYKYYPEIPLIVLIDFENDCVKTAMETARVFGKKLYGVRLDTSENMIDKSIFQSPKSNRNRYGVTTQLVRNVRSALDAEGFSYVKIVVSGGFTHQKISLFEKERTPVDIYGIGSSLLQGNIDFTADIVKVDGKNIAKEGRTFIPIKKGS